MTERAAHLVDAVLPWVLVRQWVLTAPYRLRYQMAWNHGLSRAVLRVYTRVLLGESAGKLFMLVSRCLQFQAHGPNDRSQLASKYGFA
jgi:hypothetical protein